MDGRGTSREGRTTEGRFHRSLARLLRRTSDLRTEVHALYLASRDPRTPLRARVLLALVLAYAVSPIDLIPDFIPVLGYLDDLVIVPLGLAAAGRMIPPEVLAEARAKAAGAGALTGRQGLVGAVIVVLLWIAGAYIVLTFLLRFIG